METKIISTFVQNSKIGRFCRSLKNVRESNEGTHRKGNVGETSNGKTHTKLYESQCYAGCLSPIVPWEWQSADLVTAL